MTVKECLDFLKEHPEELDTYKMNYNNITDNMRDAIFIFEFSISTTHEVFSF